MSWQMSGTGGAEIRLVFPLLPLGDLGLEVGLDMEEALARRTIAGLASWRLLSSGSGPRVEPPLAELTPDMAETESPDLLRDRIRLAWIC